MNLLDRRLEECPYYERGFCKLGGLQCPLAHSFTKVCVDYTLGFCPKGPLCEQQHIKSMISDTELALSILANFPEAENWTDRNAGVTSLLPFQKPVVSVRCHRCGQEGHKSTYCQEDQILQEDLNKMLAEDEQYNVQN